MPQSGPSLATRAALAVALLVGFYVLAVALAGLLLFLPYAELRFAHRLDPRLLIFGVGGAGVILYSAWPRGDKFTAPGPRLGEGEQPRLFGLIRDLARRVGQQAPAEVYLVHDMNAWVSQRGGFLGLGGTRIMGIGLALLHSLDVSELRAVLAHEFGHYDGGDTKLGTFVYQARSAIGRTVQHLSRSGGGIRLLQAPFRAYGNLFLRVSQKVSRAQELRADALAADVAGPGALKTGLRKIHALDPAYAAFLNSEYSPVLSMHLLAPAGEGFARFLAAPSIRPKVRDMVERIVDLEQERAAREPGQRRAFESHPRLPERIAAIDLLHLREQPEDRAPAIGLLDGVPALDALVSRAMLNPELLPKLKDARWDEVGTNGCLPHYRKETSRLRPVVGHERVAALHARWPELRERTLRWMDTQPKGSMPSLTNDRLQLAVWMLGAALAVALADHGSTLVSLPGDPVLARGPGGDAEPFELARGLDRGAWTEAEWLERCRRFGLAEATLGGVEPPAPAAASAAPVAGS